MLKAVEEPWVSTEVQPATTKRVLFWKEQEWRLRVCQLEHQAAAGPMTALAKTVGVAHK